MKEATAASNPAGKCGRGLPHSKTLRDFKKKAQPAITDRAVETRIRKLRRLSGIARFRAPCRLPALRQKWRYLQPSSSGRSPWLVLSGRNFRRLQREAYGLRAICF